MAKYIGYLLEKTGGRIMKKIKAGIVSVLLICCILCSPINLICAANKENTDSEQIADAKRGIVEIETGFSKENGKFYKMKHGSGFLVCNSKDEGVFIVTNTSKVTLSEKQKKEYCKKHKIKFESQQDLKTVFRVIVDGDVTEDLTMLSSSKEQDICILESENVIQTKKALPLENQQEVEIGDRVYAMGFSEGPTNDYTAENVEIHGGEVEDSAARIKQENYIQHTASINTENSGGPLLSQEGYVIGINNATKSVKGTTSGYALPVTELITLLDNYGVSYDSKERHTTYAELEKYYKECQKKIDSNTYRSASVENLESALKEVKSMLSDGEESSIKDYKEAKELLEEGEQGLVKKTSKLRMVSVVLAVVIGVLGIWLVVLLVQIGKRKRNESALQKQGNTERNERENIVIRRVSPDNEENIEREGLESVAEEKTDERDSSALYMEEERTMILGSGYRPYEAYLKGTVNNQKMLLDKAKVIIGKSREVADCIIKENSAVSREHAKICWSNGAYYLYDLHSANGTFLNGKKVDDRGVKLTEGDKIVFANEMYEFNMKREG